jgi:hypothetical protein
MHYKLQTQESFAQGRALLLGSFQQRGERWRTSSLGAVAIAGTLPHSRGSGRVVRMATKGGTLNLGRMNA